MNDLVIRPYRAFPVAAMTFDRRTDPTAVVLGPFTEPIAYLEDSDLAVVR
jgi:hypothetical protein